MPTLLRVATQARREVHATSPNPLPDRPIAVACQRASFQVYLARPTATQNRLETHDTEPATNPRGALVRVHLLPAAEASNAVCEPRAMQNVADVHAMSVRAGSASTTRAVPTRDQAPLISRSITGARPPGELPTATQSKRLGHDTAERVLPRSPTPTRRRHPARDPAPRHHQSAQVDFSLVHGRLRDVRANRVQRYRARGTR
jgi:hypothetical protein